MTLGIIPRNIYRKLKHELIQSDTLMNHVFENDDLLKESFSRSVFEAIDAYFVDRDLPSKEARGLFFELGERFGGTMIYFSSSQSMVAHAKNVLVAEDYFYKKKSAHDIAVDHSMPLTNVYGAVNGIAIRDKSFVDETSSLIDTEFDLSHLDLNLAAWEKTSLRLVKSIYKSLLEKAGIDDSTMAIAIFLDLVANCNGTHFCVPKGNKILLFMRNEKIKEAIEYGFNKRDIAQTFGVSYKTVCELARGMFSTTVVKGEDSAVQAS